MKIEREKVYLLVYVPKLTNKDELKDIKRGRKRGN